MPTWDLSPDSPTRSGDGGWSLVFRASGQWFGLCRSKAPGRTKLVSLIRLRQTRLFRSEEQLRISQQQRSTVIISMSAFYRELFFQGNSLHKCVYCY